MKKFMFSLALETSLVVACVSAGPAFAQAPPQPHPKRQHWIWARQEGRWKAALCWRK